MASLSGSPEFEPSESESRDRWDSAVSVIRDLRPEDKWWEEVMGPIDEIYNLGRVDQKRDILKAVHMLVGPKMSEEGLDFRRGADAVWEVVGKVFSSTRPNDMKRYESRVRVPGSFEKRIRWMRKFPELGERMLDI